MKINLKKVARILLIGSFLSFLTAFIMSGFPVFVFLWNLLSPDTSSKLSEILSKPIGVKELSVNPEYILPEQDLSLPLENRITIQRIGVDTEIVEQPQENYEDALRIGVWRTPGFGTPIDRNNPIILVAHRFGYLSWDQTYRKSNSFYNLPQLEEGDQLEIIWDQRKFTYEIFKAEEGVDISQYGADLILYTCKFLESDIRIFRYAKLVQ